MSLSLVEIAELFHALATAPLEALFLATRVAGMKAWRTWQAVRSTFFILKRVLGALLTSSILAVVVFVELAWLTLFARFHFATFALALDVHACPTLNMSFCINRSLRRGWRQRQWSGA